MYKKLFFGLVGIIIVALLVVSLGMPLFAREPEYSYQVRVLSGGQPVQDAYVRLAGVGVEMTRADGIAVFDVSDAPGRGKGRQGLYRGARYATNKGKIAGTVTDEYDLYRITVSSHDVGETPSPKDPSYTLGTEGYLKLNAVYDIDIN
tara:strand:- start:258 stop:701 length:444 start_codon:yes stop_codon:yes gene_type:complete